jgi:hypothetical protein
MRAIGLSFGWSVSVPRPSVPPPAPRRGR